MILSKHAQRSQSQITYPSNPELAPPSLSSPELLSSPHAAPKHSHKHSLSKPITWLNRSSSSTSNHSFPRVASKPTRISEPKLSSSLEQFAFRRTGPLGSGATVVRTPQEALFGSPRAFEPPSEEEGETEDALLLNVEKNESRLLPPRPSSPPLPPLPDISDAEAESRQSVGSTSVPLSDPPSHPRSSSSPSPAAHRSPLRPTLPPQSRAPSRSMPAPLADAEPAPPQPPFEAILLSPIPDGAIDPSKLVVALETCTTTYRTSLRSLVSRPSYLSRYMTSLLSPPSETTSVYSNVSDTSLSQHGIWFNSIFRDHLTSSGCLPQPSSGIHIFLDRPSAPYAHVLAYLRSPLGTPEQPEALPRAVQFGPMSPSRLESLLELRDEASYLGLAELYKLCCHEITRFHGSPSVLGTLRGKTGSVHSFRTLVEQYQPHPEARPPDIQVSKSGGRPHTAQSAARKSSSSSCETRDVVSREKNKQDGGIKCEAGLGLPPPGWI